MQREFILGLGGLSRYKGSTVATIGSFDGVHQGHQQILVRVVAKAKSLGVASAVIIFEPQPYEYFAKSATRPRLMRLREKVAALFAAGVDKVVCLRFNKALSQLNAEGFVQQVLVDGLGIKHLEIGDDFRFGADRAGDFNLLQAMGRERNFTVANSHTFEDGDERVSSTRIRSLLEQHQLGCAERLLGKAYSITGRVVYGRQLGRTIGVPTANVGLGRYAAAVSGVYAVTVMTAKGQYFGVANVGVKPTVQGESKPLLEAHIFDFDGDLYGQWITVTFKTYLRGETQFSSLNALKQQIADDIAQAKASFAV